MIAMRPGLGPGPEPEPVSESAPVSEPVPVPEPVPSGLMVTVSARTSSGLVPPMVPAPAGVRLKPAPGDESSGPPVRVPSGEVLAAEAPTSEVDEV